MPTKKFAGVKVTTLVFLLFIYMIPIDCKITNFSLCLFPFKKITIIISWHTPSYLISGKPDTLMLCIHSFSAHYAAL